MSPKQSWEMTYEQRVDVTRILTDPEQHYIAAASVIADVIAGGDRASPWLPRRYAPDKSTRQWVRCDNQSRLETVAWAWAVAKEHVGQAKREVFLRRIRAEWRIDDLPGGDAYDRSRWVEEVLRCWKIKIADGLGRGDAETVSVSYRIDT